jgi:hypothetical protein
MEPRRLSMLRISTIAIVVLWTSAVFANSKPTDDEAEKVKSALAEWNCEGGAIEKETEGTGIFEVDDTKCKGMQYDAKFDSSYKLIDMTRD